MADLDALRARLRQLDAVIVAFSGGADSAFLAWLATDTLGAERVLAATAVSPSLAAEERDDCRLLATEWAMRWREVETDELDDVAYQTNDGDRCYWCKSSLMDALEPLARETGFVIALGVNLDDLGDHRPGQRAASERGAVFPLVDAGFTKADVRAWSKEFGLRTWDKPAAACLASRIPYGTSVTVEVLSRVERAERALHQLGFAEVRVRHYGDVARVELPVGELARAIEARADVVAAVRSAGYEYATLDLEGLRSGNLNAALTRGGHSERVHVGNEM